MLVLLGSDREQISGSSYLNNLGTNGNYWSSSLNNEGNSYQLNFNGNNLNADNNNSRNNGYCVRGLALILCEIYKIMKLTKEQLFRDIYIAFVDAKKHKSNKSYVKEFEVNLKENLEELCNDLWNRNYEPGRSTCFIVHHPSKREVFAAEFRDRIVHHLYFNYTHELFERTFIYDSYSCIKKRGTHFGIHRLEKHIREESQNYTSDCYVLKVDRM